MAQSYRRTGQGRRARLDRQGLGLGQDRRGRGRTGHIGILKPAGGAAHSERR